MMKTKILLAGLACVMMAATAQSQGMRPLPPGHSEPPHGGPDFPRRPGGPWQPPTGCRAQAQQNVDWHGCDLRGADLTGADLTGANLIGANLTGAKLKGAKLKNVSVSTQTIWRSGKNCTGNKVSSCKKK